MNPMRRPGPPPGWPEARTGVAVGHHIDGHRQPQASGSQPTAPPDRRHADHGRDRPGCTQRTTVSATSQHPGSRASIAGLRPRERFGRRLSEGSPSSPSHTEAPRRRGSSTWYLELCGDSAAWLRGRVHLTPSAGRLDRRHGSSAKDREEQPRHSAPGARRRDALGYVVRNVADAVDLPKVTSPRDAGLESGAAPHVPCARTRRPAVRRVDVVKPRVAVRYKVNLSGAGGGAAAASARLGRGAVLPGRRPPGGRPKAGLEFVEKLLTTNLTSTDTTERNAACFASLQVDRCAEALSSTIAMRVVAGSSMRAYRRNATSSPRRTICGQPHALLVADRPDLHTRRHLAPRRGHPRQSRASAADPATGAKAAATALAWLEQGCDRLGLLPRVGWRGASAAVPAGMSSGDFVSALEGFLGPRPGCRRR